VAFELHRKFLKDVALPHMTVFGSIVFLAELVFAGSKILGLAVRFGGVVSPSPTRFSSGLASTATAPNGRGPIMS
jgi:hypothetical protein